MPYRKKKTTYRRKRRTRRASYPLSRNMGHPSGVPRQRVVKMRYASLQLLTSTSGSIASHIFSANNVFDPNITGAGHQPISYDTMSTLYNHYVVLGSRCTSIYTESASSNTNPGICGAYLTDNTGVPYASINSYIESGKGTWKPITGAQGQPTKVMSKFSAKKYYNVKDVKDNVSRIGAAVTASPADQAYFFCWYASTDGSSNAIYLHAIIDYIVLFSEPKDPVES